MTYNNHNTPQPTKQKAAVPFHTSEMQIGNTTYIVRTYFKPSAREGVLDKLWRLIRNNGSPSL